MLTRFPLTINKIIKSKSVNLSFVKPIAEAIKKRPHEEPFYLHRYLYAEQYQLFARRLVAIPNSPNAIEPNRNSALGMGVAIGGGTEANSSLLARRSFEV